MARCAVCHYALQAGDQFALIDEFAIHRRCQGGAIRVQSQLRDAKAETERLERQIRHQANDLESRARSLGEQLNSVHDQYLRSLASITELHGQLAAKERELETERRQRRIGEARLRELQAVARTAPTPAEEPISEEPVDETAARFRLLELD